MNSTLRPHLLAEALSPRNQPLPPQKISTLFFAYRGFPHAFAFAFRLRCHVSKQYSKYCYYKPAVWVTAKGGTRFVFDHKLVHIPILLRIAGRLAYRIDALDIEGSWVEPFLEGVDENRRKFATTRLTVFDDIVDLNGGLLDLKHITSSVGTAFLLRYLKHHVSLPTLEFGGRYASTVSLAVLDDLKKPEIDTIVITHPSIVANKLPCRVANIVLGKSLQCTVDPPHFKGKCFKFDINFLRSYTICCEVPLYVVLKMISGKYKKVQELTFRKVRLQVPTEYWYIQGVVEQINANIDQLWTSMLEHSGAVTVGAFFNRYINGPSLGNACQTGLAGGYVVTERAGCVECKLQKMEGNKKLNVCVIIHCWN